MNFDEVYDKLEEIAAISARNEKETLIRLALEDETFRKVAIYAYDPFRTYGITARSFAVVKGVNVGTQFMARQEAIWGVLDSLAKRLVTGGAANAAVLELMSAFSEKTQTVIHRILNKDLRAGFTSGSINRARPGTISVFEVMLSHKFEEKRIKKWPVAVEPKIDGMRVIITVRGDSVDFFSRTGKRYPALSHLAGDVLKVVEEAQFVFQNEAGKSYMFDAEVTSGVNFNETGAVRRHESDKNANLRFFDIIDLDDFESDKTENSGSFEERRARLERMLTWWRPESGTINMVEQHKAECLADISYWYDNFQSRGFEGAMVKPLDGIYVKKRSFAWLKMKAEETEDLIVKGVFEGEGKYVGRLGGVIVDRNGVDVRIGGGFSDSEREEYWRDQSLVISRMAEIEFHEITPDGSLRHPRFKRWRDDKHEQAVA